MLARPSFSDPSCSGGSLCLLLHNTSRCKPAQKHHTTRPPRATYTLSPLSGLLQHIPGLGVRALRYSLLADDGVVKILNVRGERV